ncbi:MAG TPA: cobalamin-dependent protein, partial [Opitutales bacterium]|nr:cobalamin-dependent protein [Opitutales bacterium]
MSARVLLISFNRYRDPYPVFPLGTAYLADSLVSAGHAVMPVDLNVDGPEWIDAARGFSPQLIGISIRNVDEVNIDGGETLLGGLRELVTLCRGLSGAKIVIGGPAVSLFPAEILRLSGADMAVRGEGETAIRLLADAAAEGRELAAPWLLKPGVRREPASAPPGFAPVSDAAFRRRLAPFYLAHSGMMNLQTQRGCPLKCSYCTYPSIEGAHVRRREMADVMAELRLMKEAGARYFFIVDGVLNNARSHVVEFCEALIREKLDLSWCCFLRPSKIDAELARLMARAGLAHAEMGSDSLAGEMLASYGKP